MLTVHGHSENRHNRGALSKNLPGLLEGYFTSATRRTRCALPAVNRTR